ncbi:cobyric acid synthase [Desulfatitalea alkaliphila]|uniref:Cobyric acid synthase n=1 Tax=Desulfatitalea alkaliphila TaxID=2929485 RepID=A0AA41UHS2_9BACT|nr:cobyric acid synthase [Desulfatitalea alkaliphila]MCJ8499935.1 cobyric acid synthase [Desulfatitalea alkaliphila]
MGFAHGGYVRALAAAAGCAVEELLDFSANMNPLGPPEGLRGVVAAHLGEVVHYPDPLCQALRESVAGRFGIGPDEVVPGNGSTELIYALPRALGVRRAVLPVPGYIDYGVAAERAGVVVETVPLAADRGFAMDWDALADRLRGDEMVVIGRPSNPAGVLCDGAELVALADRFPDTWFVVDEAFVDFAGDDPSLIRCGRPNVVVLRSMTKFYAIPGIRLGYAVAAEAVARRLNEQLPPWSVGSLAQAVGAALVTETDYAARSRAAVARLRAALQVGLAALPGLRPLPSAANYLLVRMARGGMDARDLAKALLQRRLAIRVCDNYAGLDRYYFRVAVRTDAENERLLALLSEVLGPAERPVPVRRRVRPAPAVMFQGVSSNAGKSVLTAAFCRILLQDGYRVTPFKAQNMSLNSFVTRDGGEMGRAQVVQAQACRLDPDVRMNPVLLKPNSATGAQVIVMGRPVGNMDVGRYIDYKPQAFTAVREAYDALAAESDVMVLEGAGSPAEVNLKHHDIVNMAMARHAQAPVLLVGDIDRGGVFAAFVGTMELLSEAERRMTAGFVINRFRGQQALLGDAMDRTARHTGLPTFGVVPYIPDLGLPEEDSVSFKCGAQDPADRRDVDGVTIAVVDLPHISNFTDIDSLRIEPDVQLRIVRSAADLAAADAVILPGSKNVPGDLRHLQDNGMAGRLLELVRAGDTTLVGICGGLQMLGRTIGDPFALESSGGPAPIQGLGLLPVDTVLASEKTLRLVRARHVASGLSLQGYEIHHGQTVGDGAAPAVVREDGAAVGFDGFGGRIFGTYLHGLFDNDGFRRWFIDDLRQHRGLVPLGKVQAHYDIEPALDRLAAIVRANLDVAAIYRCMGLQ